MPHGELTESRGADAHTPVNAVVVEELALVRAGIGAVLGSLGVEVVAETHSGREAASVVAAERPEVVVVGSTPDLRAVDVVRRLVQGRRRAAIVVLLPPAGAEHVRYLVALGVAAVSLRAGSTDEVAAAVEAALKGEQFVAPALHHGLAGAVRPRDAVRSETGPALSGREREVLALLAEGRSNREIAATLSVTLATVKSHLVRIYAKLGANNRNEALGRAVARGLLG